MKDKLIAFLDLRLARIEREYKWARDNNASPTDLAEFHGEMVQVKSIRTWVTNNLTD